MAAMTEAVTDSGAGLAEAQRILVRLDLKKHQWITATVRGKPARYRISEVDDLEGVVIAHKQVEGFNVEKKSTTILPSQIDPSI